MRVSLISRFIGLALLLATPAAHAEFTLDWGGMVQSDVRFRTQKVEMNSWYNRLTYPDGVSRNMNLFKLRANAGWSRVRGMVDVDFLWTGYTNQVQDFTDLFERNRTDPFRLKAHAAYAEILDMFVPGLDVRLGQQLVLWGVGDTINPTNVINSNDFEDPLLFGYQVANSMLRVDYTPWQDWSLSLVVVPIFKPAILPLTALYNVRDSSRSFFQQEKFRLRQAAQNNVDSVVLQYPLNPTSAPLQVPGVSFDNMQYAARLAGNVAGQDVAISYYYGRRDQPVLNQINVNQTIGRRCNPKDPTDCINGTLDDSLVLGFPRFQMLGINVAGAVPVANLGYHIELGVFWPQKVEARIFQNNLQLAGGPYIGEADYQLGGARPLIQDSTPFAKWNIGVDYAFPHAWWLGIQYVHGYVDEFGNGIASRNASVLPGSTGLPVFDATICYAANGENCVAEETRPRVGDYLVLTATAAFLADRLQATLWMIWDMTSITTRTWNPNQNKRIAIQRSPFDPQYASAIISPNLTYAVGGGLEATVGAMARLGTQRSKFGDPGQGGGTEVYTRMRYAF